LENLDYADRIPTKNTLWGRFDFVYVPDRRLARRGEKKKNTQGDTSGQYWSVLISSFVV